MLVQEVLKGDLTAKELFARIEKVRWMMTHQVKEEERRRRNGLRGTLSSRVRTCRTTPPRMRQKAVPIMDRLSGKRLSAIGRVQALADLVITLAKGGTIPDWKKAPPTLREAIVYHEDLSTGEDAVTLFGQRGEIPEEDRDENVPAWMRALVFARDGHRCGLCGSTEHLMAHHLRSLAKGGRTCIENFLTCCRGHLLGDPHRSDPRQPGDWLQRRRRRDQAFRGQREGADRGSRACVISRCHKGIDC